MGLLVTQSLSVLSLLLPFTPTFSLQSASMESIPFSPVIVHESRKPGRPRPQDLMCFCFQIAHFLSKYEQV
jgi:hypothetical protein